MTDLIIVTDLITKLEQLRKDLVTIDQNHAACRVDEAISEIEALRKSLEEAGAHMYFLSNHLQGRMGDGALTEMALKANEWLALSNREGSE